MKAACDIETSTASTIITIAKSANVQSVMYRVGEVLLISYNKNLTFGII